MSALKCAQCGLINFATATQCKRCGILFVQTVSSPTGSNLQGFITADGYVLPPPPSVGLPLTGIWRDKQTLVMSKEAQLPQRCVKCNAVTNGRMTRKLSWHHPAIFAVLLVNLLVYLIVAMIVRKRATVEIGLCDEHRAKRQTYIWITLVLVMLGFGGFVVAIMAEDGLPALVGLLLLLASLVFGVFAIRLVSPSKIDERFVWLRGVHSDYLNQFPSWPGI
ncbi:MAG TPA: hypothetical protein VGN90_16155 [Pyrinomonadaceae bacterium]|nr:hypothetical protein [Pyrinomonadaceae bacterium]